MKKVSLLLISLFLFVGIGTTNVVAETTDTIKNSTTSKLYENLEVAISEVSNGETLVLLRNFETHGVSVPSGKNFTFDLGGYTYSISKPGAGSNGTKTQGFQLLKDSTIVFKNGTIQCTEANKGATWNSDTSEKGIAMLIQNYANLTLENITLNGTNIAHNGNNVRYVMSNNCGTVNINGGSIIAPDGDFAFDSCKYSSYDAPTVNVKGTTITGKVEASGGAINFKTGTTVNGQVRVGENKNGGATGSVVTVEEGATLNNSGNYAAVVFGNNTLNISGTVNGIVGTNGNDYNGNETINVKDNATITNESDVAMYIPNGTLNISGGTITGKTAVYFKSTNINITGGTLIGKGEKAEYKYDGSGCNPTGDALVIDSCKYPHDIVNVSVSGGVFVSQKGSSIASFTHNGGKKQTGFISGGSFSDVTLEALNYLDSSAEIEYALLDNVDINTKENRIEITDGIELVLNLGDNTVTYSGPSLNSGVLLVHNGADVTINANNGGINSGSNAYAAIALTKSGDDATKTAKLTINGGTFSGYYYGITGNGNRQNTSITINGGNIKGTKENESTGIYNPQKGTLTINGGTIEGATGIYVKSGKVVTSITGGTIKGVGAKGDFSHNDNGFSSTGDAIVFENCNYPGGAPKADIKGGKFYSTNAAVVASYNTTGYEPIEKFVTGGLYSKKVDSKLISVGYKCVSNNDSETKTEYPFKVELVDEESFVEETLSTDATLKTLVDGDVVVTKVTGLENAKSSSAKQELVNRVKTDYQNAENIDIQIVLNAKKVDNASTDAKSIKIDPKVTGINGVDFKNFVDLTIDLEVKVDGEVKDEYKEKIPNTSAYQYIPIKAEGDLSSCDVKKIIVVRNHNDNIEILTKAASRNDAQHYNGDCFFIETIDSTRYIVVKSNKFSVYGLAMQTNDVNEYKYVAPTPYTPGGYVPPKTGVN